VTATEIPILKAGASSALPDPIAAHAAQRFADAGVLILKDLLPAERITALHEAYAIEYGDIGCRSTGNHIMEVGDKRLMTTLGVSGIFAAPEIFAHPVALSIVSPLLGNDFTLGSYVAVISMAGAKAQRLHTDLEGLFGDDELDASVPPYSITLVIPLVGLNQVTGSTRFFPGTHRDPEAISVPDGIAPDLDPGDAILFDSRISHGGIVLPP
jgi:hypothetical protein